MDLACAVIVPLLGFNIIPPVFLEVHKVFEKIASLHKLKEALSCVSCEKVIKVIHVAFLGFTKSIQFHF